MRVNQVVAIFGLVLSCTAYLLLYKFGFPDKICFGAAVFSILFVALVWTTACLFSGAYQDDDDDQ